MEPRHITFVFFSNGLFLFMMAFESVFVQKATATKNLAFTAFWISAQIVIWGGAYLLDRRSRLSRVKIK